MAINVNTVYQTVLSIINKEQRGYITPDEFNKLGTQVQLEIFETYFESLNQQLRIPQTDVDYGDRIVSLDEKISLFKRFDNTAYSNGSFSMPVLSTALTQSFQTTGNASYTITNISTAQLAEQITVTLNGNAITGFSLSNNVITFTGASIPPASILGSTISTASVAAITQVLNPGNIATTVYPFGYAVTSPGQVTTGSPTVSSTTTAVVGVLNATNITTTVNQGYVIPGTVDVVGTIKITSTGSDFYKLGTVVYSSGALAQQELERVDRGELFHLNSSNLTKPSTVYPVYLLENNRIIVYPTTIQSGISASYIKKPSDIIWNFILGANGQYIYSGSGSTNFELHPAEQTEVVLKTLLYAGVVIKDPQIIQVAAQQVAQEQMNQKS